MSLFLRSDMKACIEFLFTKRKGKPVICSIRDSFPSSQMNYLTVKVIDDNL